MSDTTKEGLRLYEVFWRWHKPNHEALGLRNIVNNVSATVLSYNIDLLLKQEQEITRERKFIIYNKNKLDHHFSMSKGTPSLGTLNMKKRNVKCVVPSFNVWMGNFIIVFEMSPSPYKACNWHKLLKMYFIVITGPYLGERYPLGYCRRHAPNRHTRMWIWWIRLSPW